MINLTDQTLLDNYHIDQQLYAGEASQVWRARDLTNEKPVVIKCMQVSLVDDPDFVQRFRQRLALVRDLDHPHIITIHTYDNQDGDWYVVMEYMADHSLRAVMNQRAHDPQVWPLARVLDLVRQAAAGLEYAHARNVLHLNLKPSNLLLTRQNRLHKPLDYTLKISDFGLASHIGVNTRLRDSLSPDTLAHLSPEQFHHQRLDGRSDIYVLGVVLYELVTGHLPFETKSFSAAVTNHVHTSPLAPRLARPDLNLSPKLEQLIMRCLAKQPDERFATMADLSQALQEVVLDLASSPASVVSAPASTANAPRVWALRQGQAVWGHTLTGNGLTIGRVPHDNDGVLDAEGVADHHLQIDWDGVQVNVTDLTAGGENETTQAWAWRTTLPVGPFSLLLEPPATAANTVNGKSMPAAGATPEPAASSAASARSKTRSTKHIEVSVDQSAPLNITPGQSVPPITIMLNNTGKRPDHITVMVSGKLANRETHIPVKMAKDAAKKLESTVRIDPPRVHIYQRDSQPVTLNVTAPRDPLLLAGTYDIDICANSLNNQEDAGATHALAGKMQATWHVQPFLANDLKVTPQARGWRKGVYKVDLTNKGNAPADYALSVSDADEDELRFHFTPTTFTLNPGKSQRARLRVNPRQWRWFGNAQDVQQHTFTVTSEGQLAGREMTEEPDTRTAQCRFKQHALFPRWLPRILLFLLLAALASGFLLHGCNRGPVAGQSFLGMRAGWILSPTPTPTMTMTSTAIPTATATRTIPPTSTPIPPPTPLPPTPLPPTPTSTPTATPTATATMTPTPLPYDEVCVPGREIIIAGSGPSQAPLLAYFDLVPENQSTRGEHAVGGGSTNQTGQFAIPLRIAPRTPPGIYTVTIRIRGTNEIVRQILCLVPDRSTPTPSPETDTPTPTQ